MLISRKAISSVLWQESPNLIEVGDPYWSAWISLGLAQELGIPIVAYYHSDYPRALGRTILKFGGPWCVALQDRFVNPYLRHLYNRMDVTLVATSKFRRVLKGIGIQRLVQIPLGINVAVFRPYGSREKIFRELGLHERQRLLLYVGRLAREKNLPELLLMMDKLPTDIGVHLLIVGDGEMRHLAQRTAQSSDCVSWWPYCITPSRLAEIYSAADLFVHPGTSETFGFVSIEAQACGTRVLGVRGGGLEETLAGEDPCFLAKGESAENLAEAVVRTLQFAEDEGLRRARRERIARHFSSERMCDQLFNLYRGLVDGHTIEESTSQGKGDAA
jgi:alpha-1,6-mannosyltransferase